MGHKIGDRCLAYDPETGEGLVVKITGYGPRNQRFAVKSGNKSWLAHRSALQDLPKVEAKAAPKAAPKAAEKALAKATPKATPKVTPKAVAKASSKKAKK